jgi:methylenetetrahydrofolate dehydrogenase (NADP+) / methenyltetrahydrofolate cyclohydrolase
MILDGKKAAEELFSKLKEHTYTKTLAVIQIGENPASTAYINLKKRKAEELGIKFQHSMLPDDVQESKVIEAINVLNYDSAIGGILVQLPIPEHLNKQKVLDSIDEKKDIDCLTSKNLGLFFSSESNLLPATPYGILKLLDFYNIDVTGKDICIIGASNLVGKPLAVALTNREATVTLCHIKTKDVKKISSTADIVITAVGRPALFTEDYFSSGQTVIDVGTSKNSEGKLVGDVDYERVSKIVENITPVPGGVGPMTIYALVENFVKLTQD